MQIGAQLFTLREACRTLKGFAEALDRVADMGYQTVQVSGTCAFEPAWLADQLKRTGLSCVITHTAPERIKADPEAVFVEHREFGCSHIGIGCIPGGLDQAENYNRFVEDFQPAARRIAELGGRLMYHNHQLEFMRAPDGERYFDKFIRDFSPEELGFTLDTYWVQYGGGDPAQWLERLNGRVPCIHLKDMACVEREPRMAPVGEGNLNFDRIFAAAERAGTRYMLVEQDDCYGEDPFDCLKRSYAYLRAQGFQ